MPAVVEDVIFVGAITQVSLRPTGSSDRTLTAKLTSGEQAGVAPGSPIDIRIAPEDVSVVAANKQATP